MRLETSAVVAALLACTTPARTAAQPLVPSRAGPYAVDLLDERGAPLRAFEQRGRTYALGALGQRYRVRVRNGAPWRAEVVVSVDGRDVLDGRPASMERRGYVVEPHGEVTIDGYRLGLESVATFRFATVPRSYAALKGDARDVGVIGVAVFRERAPQPIARPPYPYPSYRPSDPGARGRGAARPVGGARALRRRPVGRGRAARGGRRDGARRSAAPPPGPGSAPSSARSAGRWRTGSASSARARGPRRSSRCATTIAKACSPSGSTWTAFRYGRADDAWLRESAEPFRRDRGFAEPPPGWLAP